MKTVKSKREMPEREKYIVYSQDLKFRHKRDIDPNWAEWESDHVKEKFNIDHESLEYRLNECKHTNFKTLDLSEMNLTTLPCLDKNIVSNVEHLFINNNRLNGTLDVTHFKSLKIIDFSENNVVELKANEGVEELVCRKNNLVDIPTIKTFVRLDCSNNKITSIDIPSKLKILICSGNMIKRINDSKSINKLICDNNPISFIGILPNLVHLDISQTSVTTVNKYEKLQSLVLNNTKTSKLPLFENLEMLEIINTPIDTIEFMPKIKSIICSVNKTKKIAKEYNDKIEIKLHKGQFLVINVI